MNLQEAMARIAELEEQLELQRLLADNAFEAIGVFDENLRCIAANKESAEVLGYEPDEAIGCHILEFIANESHAEAARSVDRDFSEPYYLTGLRKDGTTFPAEARGKSVLIKGKTYRVASLHDISFREDTKADLRSSLHEMELIFANTKVGLMFLKGDRKIRRVNQTMAELFGYASPADMRGMSARQLHMSDKTYFEFGKNYVSTLAEGAQLNVEYRMRKKDGTPIWCSLSGQAVDTATPIDLNKGVLWVVVDISARKEEEKRLKRLATTDDLTGALSRKEFFRLAEQILENDKRTMSGPSLLMIDIDHFKKVNDTYGHEVGDTVLRTFAKECRSILRENDLFTRLGGEEFAVFLPSADLGRAIIVAERLRKKIADSTIKTRDTDLRYTISIGTSGVGRQRINLKELLRRADESLYEAKRDGRNRVAFYD